MTACLTNLLVKWLPHSGGEALPAPGAIVGVCEDMCPAAERERREHLHDIQIFERVDINDSGRTSAELAVRRFARTIDDPQPTDFRTRAALLRTMLYLRSLLDRQDVRFGLVHKFLWDRYRAVRQDLYVQGITDEFAIAVYEEVVRFHVMCEHELCGEDQSVTEMEGFNSHLNIEQMNKALISLSDMYETQAEKGQPVQSEPEFRAYHLLSLMAQHGKFKGDQQAFLATLQALRAEVKTSPPILWVLQLQRAYACDNYVAFFSLVDRAPYLMACLAHVYFPQIRARALRALADSFNPSSSTTAAASLDWLKDLFYMDTADEAAKTVVRHGFAIGTAGAGVQCALLVKGEFVEPPPPTQRAPSQRISEKSAGLRSGAVASAQLSPEGLQASVARQLEDQRAAQEANAALAAQAQEVARQTQHAQQEAARRAALQAKEAAEAARHKAALRAEEGRRQEEEQRRRAEEARVTQEAARQLAARQREEALLRAAAEERQRMEAERAAVAAAQEAELRAAAAAAKERQRVEELQRRRRAEEEEAERRRVQAEAAAREAAEAEARRQREEQARVERERQERRASKCAAAVQKLHFARWRAFVREEAARRAARKACSVGIVRRTLNTLPGLLHWGRSQAGAPEPAAVAEDFPAIVRRALVGSTAGRLVRPSPLAPEPTVIPWKLAVLEAEDAPPAASRWLRRALAGDAAALDPGSAPCEAYVYGPGRGPTPDVRCCLAFASLGSAAPGPAAAAAIAGASAIAVLAGPAASPAGGQLARAVRALADLPPCADLPLLVLGAESGPAEEWTAAWTGRPVGYADVLAGWTGAAPDGPGGAAAGLSVQPPAPAGSNASALARGLAWAVASAPPAPRLAAVPLTTLLSRTLAMLTPGVPAQQALEPGLALRLFDAVLTRAAGLVGSARDSSAFRRRWPPAEVGTGTPLDGWHTEQAQTRILATLAALRLRRGALLHRPGGGGCPTLVTLHMLLSAEGADCSEVMVVAPSSELNRLSGQAMEAAPPCRPRHVDAWQPPLTPPPLRALGSTSRKRKLSPQETIKQESLVDKVQALQLDIRAEKQSFEALSIQSSKPATETPSGCGGRASLEMPDAPTRTLDAPGGSGLDVFELAREAAAEVRAWMER
uniref:PCI domain-containing protein n=1 Tax=Auxenochlorella protothecoides TaxID=3075 RepID=A0A1D2AG69_AUXPR